MEELFNLKYFVMRGNKTEIIEGENFFIPLNSQNYNWIEGEAILKKDYYIIKKFFNKHALYLEGLKGINFKLNKGRVDRVILEDLVEGFPQELCGLDKLNFLNLSRCKIKTIPKTIVKLKSLSELYLNDCGLERIPFNLTQLPGLMYLSLIGNNIRDKYSKNTIDWLKREGVKVELD